MKSENQNFPETAILANGKFPDHPVPLGYLLNAKRVICCDGAADALIDFGLEPFAIIGDCDSLNPHLIEKYYERIFRIEEQDTNDLTKSVTWCYDSGYKDLVILGATGKREDHTLGNISLLGDYVQKVRVKMVTDSGIFLPIIESSKIMSEKGRQVSIFSIDPCTEVTSFGLKYKLDNMKLKNWWFATLNETEEAGFTLEFKGGPLIIYMKFPD